MNWKIEQLEERLLDLTNEYYMEKRGRPVFSEHIHGLIKAIAKVLYEEIDSILDAMYIDEDD